MSCLRSEGWQIRPSNLSPAALESLREIAFTTDGAGTRCMLDVPIVRQVADSLRTELAAQGLLLASAVSIQAIAFDKRPGANWKVTWHQDLMFPFARPVSAAGFTLPAVKYGVHYARPPRLVLERLLAVRLHLDDCTAENGPLRVLSQSHRQGVIPAAQIAPRVANGLATVCTAATGELLLLRPLLLHASSPATAPSHRRVVHYVFFEGSTCAEPWHRAV